MSAGPAPPGGEGEGRARRRVGGGPALLVRRAAPALAVLLALGLRAWGLEGDLPRLYHPDEANHVAISQHIFKTGDLNPHFFNYPSLFLYLNALAYVPYYAAGRRLGVVAGVDDLREPVTLTMAVGGTDRPSTVLLGRAVTVLFGAAAVGLAFLAGRAVTGDAGAGLLGALMLAVSPTNVAYSRLITPDTFAVCFTLAALLASARVLATGERRWSVAAGVAVGLAAGSKYNAALVAVTLLAAHVLRAGPGALRDRRLALAVAAGGLAFLATTPFAVLDPGEFLADVRREARHYATGHAGMEGDTVRWYLDYLWSVEGAGTVLGLVQLARGLVQRSAGAVLLGAFPVTYFAFISRFVVRNDRTLLPVTPFLFLLAAALLADLWRWAPRRPPWRDGGLGRAAAAALALGCLAPALARTVEGARQAGRPDSREAARRWIEAHLPPGTRIAVEPYAPFLDPARFVVHGFKRLIDHPAEWYAAEGYDVLVAATRMFRRYAEHPRYAAEAARYARLFGALELVTTFSDARDEVRVYRIGPARAAVEAGGPPRAGPPGAGSVGGPVTR